MRTPAARLPAVADRHHERVHALGLAADLELGEDHGELGVPGGVADVVLASRVAVGGDHELPGVGVVRRHRAERLHVGAVAGLGHREAAHQPAGDQVGEVGVVVPLGAELEDRAAEEPELHADLHQHRQVAERERLEGRDRRADVAAAAVLLGEAHPGLAGRGHLDHEVADPVAEVVAVAASRRPRAPRRTAARLVRTRSRTSAYLPSSRAVRAGTSMSGGAGRDVGSDDTVSSAGGTVSVAMQFTLPGQAGPGQLVDSSGIGGEESAQAPHRDRRRP